MNASRRPRSAASICQGTRLAWCSISVRTIRSPALSCVRPQVEATRLIDSVALRVKTSSAGSGAPMKAAIRRRADLVGLGGLFRQPVDAAMDVGVLVLVEGGHRLEHRPRLLGRGGRIEVDQRDAGTRLALQDRELGAQPIDVEDARWRAASASGSAVHLAPCGRPPNAPPRGRPDVGAGLLCTTGPDRAPSTHRSGTRHRRTGSPPSCGPPGPRRPAASRARARRPGCGRSTRPPTRPTRNRWSMAGARTGEEISRFIGQPSVV